MWNILQEKGVSRECSTLSCTNNIKGLHHEIEVVLKIIYLMNRKEPTTESDSVTRFLLLHVWRQFDPSGPPNSRFQVFSKITSIFTAMFSYRRKFWLRGVIDTAKWNFSFKIITFLQLVDLIPSTGTTMFTHIRQMYCTVQYALLCIVLYSVHCTSF